MGERSRDVMDCWMQFVTKWGGAKDIWKTKEKFEDSQETNII